MRRVQILVGDMQRQRQELSQAVRQLTENSNTLYQQIKPQEQSFTSSQMKKRSLNQSWTETDLDSMHSIEHDTFESLDNLNFSMGELGTDSTTPLYVDTGLGNSSVNILNQSASGKQLGDYMQSQLRHQYRNNDSDGIESSGMESDDLLETSAFSNLSNQEKPEIKTVRIVKRESERRHRDRERGLTSNSSQNLDHVLEEDVTMHLMDEYNRASSLPRPYTDKHEIYTQHENKKTPTTDQSQLFKPFQNVTYNSASSVVTPIKYTDYYNSLNQYPVSMTQRTPSNNVSSIEQYLEKSATSTPSGIKSNNPFHEYLVDNTSRTANLSVPTSGLSQKTESIQSLTKTIGHLSPIFKSEAARQIINEMSGNTSEENNDKIPLASKQRRAVQREKRRHYTAPNTTNAKAMQNIQSENDMNKTVIGILCFALNRKIL